MLGIESKNWIESKNSSISYLAQNINYASRKEREVSHRVEAKIWSALLNICAFCDYVSDAVMENKKFWNTTL